MEVRLGSMFGEVSDRVAIPSKYPLRSEEPLNAHGTPGVDASCADTHLCTWNDTDGR